MKALFLATAVAAVAASAPAVGWATTPSPAASVITIGGSFARSCYLSAQARHSNATTIGECDAALATQPLTLDDRVATYVNRGILRMLGRNYGGAKADFRQALAMNPQQPEAWLNLGIARFNEGDSQEARQMFARAIELGTSNPALAYYARGLANEDRGDIRGAYADLVRARSLNPQWALPAQELQRFQVRER